MAVAVDGRNMPRPNGSVVKFPADGKPHVLSDLALGRSYEIDAPFADSWWLWNPGDERTPVCKTLASDEWHRFWCLEALMCEPKPLAAGETRVHKVRISIRKPAGE
jgi:D-hexose-6-phosphate mutarotase